MIEPIVVIGAGPAGVSAARPLLEAGLKVTLVDAGVASGPLLSLDRSSLMAMRQGGGDAWRHFIGEDIRGLRWMPELSPKLRMAQGPQDYAAFSEFNRIDARNFVAVGNLASGGLSKIWGAVAHAYDDDDMASWPIDAAALASHYRSVSARIGISGAERSDLDREALPFTLQDALPLTPLEERILSRHSRARRRPGFRLGRTRMAVLSADRGDRKACNLDGACILGCARGSIYNAAFEAAELARHPGMTVRPGFAVERLARDNGVWSIEGRDRNSGRPERLQAARVILATGALASTRLALDAAGFGAATVRLETSPSVAFAVLFPRMIGSLIPQAFFGLTQIGFSRALKTEDPADEMIGSLYNAASMSASEFLLRLPVSIAGGRSLLRNMLPGLMIGMTFMPGRYSDNRARLVRSTGGLPRLEIEGGNSADFSEVANYAIRKLRWDMLRLGGILLPGSVQTVQPGADVHYSGSLAMGRHTDTLGQMNDAPGLYIVDGAVLPTMPARNPTLTIMANAERIGTALADAWTVGG